MQCPKCKYLMTDFDDKCPRCGDNQELGQKVDQKEVSFNMSVVPPPPASKPKTVSKSSQSDENRIVFLNEESNNHKILAFSMITLSIAIMVGAGVMWMNPAVRSYVNRFIPSDDKKTVLALPEDKRAYETTTILPSKAIGIFYEQLKKDSINKDSVGATFRLMADFQIQMQAKSNELKDAKRYDQATPYDLTASAIAYLREWKQDYLSSFNEIPSSFFTGPGEKAPPPKESAADIALNQCMDLTKRADNAGVIVVKFELLNVPDKEKAPEQDQQGEK